VGLDVLLIGYNEGEFGQYMKSLRATGTDQAPTGMRGSPRCAWMAGNRRPWAS